MSIHRCDSSTFYSIFIVNIFSVLCVFVPYLKNHLTYSFSYTSVDVKTI